MPSMPDALKDTKATTSPQFQHPSFVGQAAGVDNFQDNQLT